MKRDKRKYYGKQSCAEKTLCVEYEETNLLGPRYARKVACLSFFFCH